MSAYIAELDNDRYPWRWELAFDYSPQMVQAIKDNIPSRSRRWCPERKVWWFQAGMLSSIEALARAHCGSVQYVTDRGDGEAQLVPADQAAAFKALHLLPSAPDEVVRAAYRAMCKLHHPDAGGTTREMQRVNEAFGVLAARSKERA